MSEENQEVQEVEPTTAAPESTAEQEGQPSEGEQPQGLQPETRTFTQDEVNDIVQRRLAKESRKLARQMELEAENRILRQQQTPQKSEPTGAPKAEQFDSTEDYLEALTDWKVEQRIKSYQSETEAQRVEREANERRQARAQRILESGKKYQDFKDVVFDNLGLHITEDMADAIDGSNVGADIAYYLGNNPDESQRIARLPIAQQVREIVKLESKISTPPAVTKTPPPIKPSGNSARIDTPLADVDDFKDFVARRREYTKNRR